MPLYLIATPIGNLKDISLRALEILKSVDFIYCEDTRVSRKLLSNYNIKAKLDSFHKFSGVGKIDKIFLDLEQGSSVAYISDAGMPCISDPGKELVIEAIKRGVKYSIIPGASAAICAYAGSKFVSNSFTFIGFLDKKKLKNELEKLKNHEFPIILYESPHRITSLLKEIINVMGDRQISIAREITKLYESFLHGKASEILMHDEIQNPRGEFVVVIDSAPDVIVKLEDEEIIKIAKSRVKNGEKISFVAKEMAPKGAMNRNEIYKILSELN